MRTNKSRTRVKVKTHEGARGNVGNLEDQLRRAVMSCYLWESQFYEDGIEIGERIKQLVKQLGDMQPEKVYQIANEARNEMHLRHAPVFMIACMAACRQDKHYIKMGVKAVVQRVDELGEMLAMFWDLTHKVTKMPRSLRSGMAAVLTSERFKEYHFAKYKGGKSEISLRDVLRLVRPRPLKKERNLLFHKIVKGELSIPDTWETALSSGADKRITFERLLRTKKLGGLALLRNLRNMTESGVDTGLVRTALKEHPFNRVLPYRFITAARYAPHLEPELEVGMLNGLAEFEKLPGETIVLVDISASMGNYLSGKSEMTRMQAAFGIAIMLREVCENVRIFSFSNNVVEVPARRGFALSDAIDKSQRHGGTYLGGAVRSINQIGYDRLVVFTDEQSHDQVGGPNVGEAGYMVNVASYKPGVSYNGQWRRIDGFSENIIKWIHAYESMLEE